MVHSVDNVVRFRDLFVVLSLIYFLSKYYTLYSDQSVIGPLMDWSTDPLTPSNETIRTKMIRRRPTPPTFPNTPPGILLYVSRALLPPPTRPR